MHYLVKKNIPKYYELLITEYENSWNLYKLKQPSFYERLNKIEIEKEIEGWDKQENLKVIINDDYLEVI